MADQSYGRTLPNLPEAWAARCCWCEENLPTRLDCCQVRYPNDDLLDCLEPQWPALPTLQGGMICGSRLLHIVELFIVFTQEDHPIVIHVVKDDAYSSCTGCCV